jgi:two-component system sensor histidine kinase/response regulator
MAMSVEWLDAKVLLAACGGEVAVLDVLKDAVRDGLPRALARLEQAFRVGDARALREAAHALVGMVATVSTSAGDAASEIEDAAASGDLSRVNAPLERLERVSRSILGGIGSITMAQVLARAT